MKLLRFNILIDGNAENEENSGVVSPYRMPYITEADMEWAKEHAINGEYTIEEVDQPESVKEPTSEELFNVLLGVTE